MLKYPDRTAMRIKNHPYYTNLDGQGGLSLADQAQKLQLEQMRQLEVKKQLSDQGVSTNEGRLVASTSTERSRHYRSLTFS